AITVGPTVPGTALPVSHPATAVDSGGMTTPAASRPRSTSWERWMPSLGTSSVVAVATTGTGWGAGGTGSNRTGVCSAGAPGTGSRVVSATVVDPTSATTTATANAIWATTRPTRDRAAPWRSWSARTSTPDPGDE